MRTPIADFEVHLQAGVRAQVLYPLSCAAKARGFGESAEALLDLIALRMKAVHNVGGKGPGHVRESWDSVPEAKRAAYRAAYDALIIERYFGVHIRFGVQSNPSRLMIITAHYPPAAA
ncbi:hypothetical protein [Pacificoceanicola onchidii]|uniref:hypothetical protein n=1 Tax=Pacificoceanicola onchidii TaxID=2562685 RepID=UPI0010A6A4FD|nr:hypothetical protein [Pacificoceanicola onchidii]